MCVCVCVPIAMCMSSGCQRLLRGVCVFSVTHIVMRGGVTTLRVAHDTIQELVAREASLRETCRCDTRSRRDESSSITKKKKHASRQKFTVLFLQDRVFFF